MFRRATASDRDLLDEMTLAGARHWGHHDEHPEAYAGLAAQLQAEDGPEHHPVFVLEEDGEVIAFYELRDRGDHVELLRMFMRSDLIGQGYGRVLWSHAVDQGAQTHDRMLIMSDPGAVGFYAAVGARFERSQEVAPGFSLGVFWHDLGSVSSGTQEFEGATFVRTSFRGATLRACDLSGVTMRSVDVDGLDIDGQDLLFGSLFVNGVDVVPLVDAELNRQFPGRELQTAQTPEGLRDAWAAAQAAWETTVTNTPPELVDAHVDDEWSLAQTLRHLVLVTDAWLGGGIVGMKQPFHEIGLIFTGAAEMGFDTSIFRTDVPTFEEILEVRAERQEMVTNFLAGTTPELLAEERNNPWGGGDWHPTVGDCVRVILEEEWAHLRYVRRDLALLA